MEYTREVRRRSSETYREGNARTRGEHRGRDLTGVGGNGVRTQVLTENEDLSTHMATSSTNTVKNTATKIQSASQLESSVMSVVL